MNATYFHSHNQKVYIAIFDAHYIEVELFSTHTAIKRGSGEISTGLKFEQAIIEAAESTEAIFQHALKTAKMAIYSNFK